MLLHMYVLFLLFLSGLFFGMLSILIGLKKPMKLKRIGSYCSNCNEQFEWYQLIPCVSYFFNRGKCPYCHKKLNSWFPFLELFSGIMFAMGYVLYGFSFELFIVLILVFLTINIFVSDFKHYIILDGPLIVFSVVVLVLKFIYFGWKIFLISCLSGILIFLFMLFVRYIGSKVFKQEALGGGDIKLSMLFGFILGIRLSIVALVLGSFLAFPYAIYFSLKGKNKEIPFGPFLIVGFDIIFLFMNYINNFLSLIFK